MKKTYTQSTTLKIKNKVKVEFLDIIYMKSGGSRTIVPIKFKKQNINPKNFSKLEKKFKMEDVLIFDRINPCLGNACIIDHVNPIGV